jgi:hypothetical protein
MNAPESEDSEDSKFARGICATWPDQRKTRHDFDYSRFTDNLKHVEKWVAWIKELDAKG